MLNRNLVHRISGRSSLFCQLSTAAAKITSAPNEALLDHLSALFESGKKILSRLEKDKPLKTSNVELRSMLNELFKANTVNVQLAGKILEKSIGMVNELDSNGRFSSYHLVKLVENKQLNKAVDFLKLLMKIPREMKNSLDYFCLDTVFRALVEEKEDDLGFDLLKSCKESSFPELIEKFADKKFKEDLIMNLFLPRLNWAAIEYLVSDSVQEGEIKMSLNILHDIFHVVLTPNPNDRYFDPVDLEHFTSDISNPRFHRFLELLQSWKNSGIPIKGQQMSRALEETFKRFLPTESMMDGLQKLL